MVDLFCSEINSILLKVVLSCKCLSEMEMQLSYILAVDDESNNLMIIESYLEDEGYEVDTAENGLVAWNILQKNPKKYDVILLDRMMPEMNGMELLRKIKGDNRLYDVPVIMQTAAAEKSQVLEGIDAGVYYYLTKPYESEMLIVTVNAAVADYARKKELFSEITTFKGMLRLVKRSDFEISTLDEAMDLTTFLASFYPDPERVVVGISELLVNAIEHGNLAIGYEEKTQLNMDGCWRKEVDSRLLLPEFMDKRVKIFYEQDEIEVRLRIVDEGAGFEWQQYLAFDASRATDSHGRGIAMANMMSFDELEYHGSGNEVLCSIKL
jgi:CheY-like chemotaxis protein/anti-sigma regulatory factor (Ser/Thr protein kinase)